MSHNHSHTPGHKATQKMGLNSSKFSPGSIGAGHSAEDRKPSYSKVFRWRLPEGHTPEPASVEVVGTFTNWQKVPLLRAADGWHVTLPHIPSHRTHHYMMLADGQPVKDKNSDGLAVPHGAQEEKFAITTPRGPRVLMLFSQTK
jgi:hypothetical protein